MADEHEHEIQHMIDPSVPDLSPLETLRHSAAHIMAAAIKKLWPDARLAFGPQPVDAALVHAGLVELFHPTPI